MMGGYPHMPMMNMNVQGMMGANPVLMPEDVKPANQ
jgi:hypothetical protein